MFRNLMPQLADRFRLIAPDYPEFGFSDDAPALQQFANNFDHLAEIVGKFIDALGITTASLYLQDYGGPIRFRLAGAHPEAYSRYCRAERGRAPRRRLRSPRAAHGLLAGSRPGE